MKRWETIFWPLVAIGAFLALWQAGVVWSGTRVLPGPPETGRALLELVRKGLLWSYTRDSLFRVGAGYALAVLCGMPLGMVLGWYPRTAAWIDPLTQMMRPISPLAWMPLAIIWFGVGNVSAIFLIFLASLFPILVATATGVRNVSTVFLRAGSNFGLSPAAVLLRVVFPAALPQVLVGLRIALGVAWLVVVAAEMIAVDSGLGYLIIDSRNAGKRYDLVVAGMLLIGVIGWALDTGIRQTEKLKAVEWGFRYE